MNSVFLSLLLVGGTFAYVTLPSFDYKYQGANWANGSCMTVSIAFTELL